MGACLIYGGWDKSFNIWLRALIREKAFAYLRKSGMSYEIMRLLTWACIQFVPFI